MMRYLILSLSFLLVASSIPAFAAEETKEITIMLSPADPQRVKWQSLSDEFNREHQDMRFRIIWSDLGEKLNLLTAANALPDLINVPDFQLTNIHEKLLGLDDFLNQIPGIRSQFFPNLLKACEYEGTLKLVPIFYNVPFVLYRPDLFRKAGIPAPGLDWTWEDYRRDAKALTQRRPDGSVEIYGTNVQAIWWVEWLSLVRQAGGDLFTNDGRLAINSPATRQAVEFMHDLIYADGSAPELRDMPAGGFMSGRIAIYYGGHVVELATLPFEWDIAPLPAGPAGKATGELAISGLGIWKGCKHPDAAFAVLRFILSDKSALTLSKGGLPPSARRDIAQATLLAGTPETRTASPKHSEVIVDSVAFARSVPKLKTFLQISTTVTDGISHALKDPVREHIAGLPADLESRCMNELVVMEEKQRSNPWWFAVQLVIIATATALFLRRFLKRSRVMPEEKAGQRHFFIFTAPCILGLCLFTVGPLILSFWWSQTNYNLVDTPQYVGLEQYRTQLFLDPEFWHSLRLSLIYAALAVPAGLVISLGTALLLNQNLRHIGIFRVLFYMPSILPVAASALMWIWLLHPRYGVVNRALAIAGVKGPGWFQDPHWALISLVVVSLWGFGTAMLIFLAGLKNIPASLYEAAEIDGAGTMSQFIHITLPSLAPVIFFNLTMHIIGALQIFNTAYIISTAGGGGEPGGPEKSTDFYVLNLFVKSFLHLNIGTASAMAWMFFFVIMGITGVNFWAKRLWFPSDSEIA